MTDRLKGCTVTFVADLRDDDAEPILNAIRQLRGVIDVTPSVDSLGDIMNRARVREELGQKLLDVVFPKEGGR